MSIFDDLIKIDNDGNFVYNKWIEWEHFLIPNKPDWLRQILRATMSTWTLHDLYGFRWLLFCGKDYAKFAFTYKLRLQKI